MLAPESTTVIRQSSSSLFCQRWKSSGDESQEGDGGSHGDQNSSGHGHGRPSTIDKDKLHCTVGNSNNLGRPVGIQQDVLPLIQLPTQLSHYKKKYQMLQNEAIHAFVTHNASLAHFPFQQLCLEVSNFRNQNDSFQLSFRDSIEEVCPFESHQIPTNKQAISLSHKGFIISLVDKENSTILYCPYVQDLLILPREIG